MTPIKLLRENRELLAFVEDTKTLDHDDYLEREVLHGSEEAKTLLAIENATEIAKRFVQAHYQDILRQIRAESSKGGLFRCKNLETLTRTDADMEYVHLEATLDDGANGHAIYVRADNKRRRLFVHDSMGQDAYLNYFEETLRRVYPGYAIIDKSREIQPTGGFTQDTPEQMGVAMFISGHPGYLERAWRVSQYDELSQHHFCYVEAFVAMAFDALGMHRGGPDDPRDRLGYIKRVTWGLIHRFYRGPMRGPVWDYFAEHFPTYMSTWNEDGSRMLMKNDTFQVPAREGFLRRLDRFWTVDTCDWTIRTILRWAE